MDDCEGNSIKINKDFRLNVALQINIFYRVVKPKTETFHLNYIRSYYRHATLN